MSKKHISQLYSKESIAEYYETCAAINEAHDKARYEQERMYRACLKDLQEAKDKAIAEAFRALELKECPTSKTAQEDSTVE